MPTICEGSLWQLHVPRPVLGTAGHLESGSAGGTATAGEPHACNARCLIGGYATSAALSPDNSKVGLIPSLLLSFQLQKLFLSRLP